MKKVPRSHFCGSAPPLRAVESPPAQRNTKCCTTVVVPKYRAQLFLLEVFVRCVKCDKMTVYNEAYCVPTAVSFGFLHFPIGKDEDMIITPVDPMFEPQKGLCDSTEIFYAGRSVLFPLNENDFLTIELPFIIDFQLVKKLSPEFKNVVIAGGSLDMTKHFAALRKEVIMGSQYARDTILPLPSKMVDEEIPLMSGKEATGTMCVYVRVSAHNDFIATEYDMPNPCFDACFRFVAATRCPHRMLDYVLINVSDACDAGRIGKKLSDSCCFKCEEPKPSPTNNCTRNSAAGDAVGPTGRLAAGEDCCRPTIPCSGPCIQSSRGPKQICGKAVVLKVSGLLDPCEDGQGNQQARVTVVPESEATRPEDDPENDVFILRIGKKGLVAADEKSDIQLEMRTPKGPERRPPIRLETREMQTEAEKKAKSSKKKK